MELTPYEVVQVALFLPAAFLSLYVGRNAKRLKDVRNLWFRKARTVKVNFVTLSGRVIERFIVPDSRGIMRIEGGAYYYHKDVAQINAKHRIPEITILENQIHPPTADVARVRAPILDAQVGAGDVSSVTDDVPTWVLSWRRLKPKELEGMVAQELASALNTKIINDIVNSSSPQMRKMELAFYVSLGILGVTVLGMLFLYAKLNDMQSLMEGLRFAALNR